MKLKLYATPTSPFARKVRVAAIEMGLSDMIEEVAADPFNPSTEFLAANPLSQVPTLVTEKGEALPDSSLIVDYLETRGHGLLQLPRGSRRWSTLRRGAVAEGMLGAAVAMVFEKRRPESIIYTAFLDRRADMIRRSIEMLDLEAGALAQGTPGRTEITVGVALAYLDFRLPYLDWRAGRDTLAAWYEVFAQRQSMQQTVPPTA